MDKGKKSDSQKDIKQAELVATKVENMVNEWRNGKIRSKKFIEGIGGIGYLDCHGYLGIFAE